MKNNRILNHSILFLFFFAAISSTFGQYNIQTVSAGQERSSNYFDGDTFEKWCGGPDYYSQWSNGISSDQNFFPICIWLQSPENTVTATKYREIGVNIYIGLHQGPTESQLSAVANKKTTALCNQNTIGLNSINRSCIKAWTQQDEPDNAQNGTQNPVPTEEIIKRYSTMKTNDPTRPIYLNFGDGVACKAWYGRGNRTNHPEDYIEYSKGADIVSFDIYPMNVYPRPESASWIKEYNSVVTGDISYVGKGVDNLREAVNYSKPVWVWIECTNIKGDTRYALTPVHVKAEVWMAIIHGARGIGYFCHEFSPFIEAGLLANKKMTDSVNSINSQIIKLAPVLNTRTVKNGATLSTSNESVTVDKMVKRYNNSTFVFAVATKSGTTTATFSLKGFMGNKTVEVVGEEREISMIDGVFRDTFSNYNVHIYRISNPSSSIGNTNNFENGGHLLLNCFQNNDHSIEIEYYLPSHEIVRLYVTDINGREIAVLINEQKSRGNHQITFNADRYSFAKGVYMVNLKSGNTMKSIKSIYVK